MFLIILTSISCDNKFIFLAKFDINKLNQLLLFLLIEGSGGVERVMRHPVASINRQELVVAHGGASERNEECCDTLGAL